LFVFSIPHNTTCWQKPIFSQDYVNFFVSRASLKLTLKISDSYIVLQEGVPFSDRTTWDVLRYVYHAGGLELVKNTLQLIRERRAKEPAPDYDLTSTATSRSNSTTSGSPSSDRRRNWSSQDEDVVRQTSSESARESMRKSGVARRNSSSRKVVDSPQLRRLKAPSNEAGGVRLKRLLGNL
jgi:hypothetical protein